MSHIENLQNHIHEHKLRAWCRVFHLTEAELYSESIDHITDMMLERMRVKGKALLLMPGHVVQLSVCAASGASVSAVIAPA